MSRVAFTCLLKQKLKFCSSLTHIFDEKKVSIFFKNKPVWRIFSPGFMFSEMNLWKFRHYFWQFRHYFWKLDFSSTLMLKLMETLFFKLLCRTPGSSALQWESRIWSLIYKQGLVELLPIVLAGLPGSSRLDALLTQKQWLKLDQLAQQFSNLLLYASKVEGCEGLWRLPGSLVRIGAPISSRGTSLVYCQWTLLSPNVLGGWLRQFFILKERF